MNHEPHPKTGAHQLGSHPEVGVPPATPTQPPPPAREMSPYPPLILKYLVIYLYGMTASFQGVATIDIAAGQDGRSLYWSLALMICAIGAIFGVIRSLLTSRYIWETLTTGALLVLLGGYVIAIVSRAIYEPGYTGLATAWLPIALGIFPICRLFNIAPRKRAQTS